MDAKALAKSKRAHSLRHTKKNNHHSASKLPSVSSDTATANKKPAGEQVGENLRKTHGSRALPSNWDRYNEEINLGSEDPSGESASGSTEFVVPKSKGADYAFLISEAKAQQQLNYSSDSFSSFSDNFEEFTQGFGPMLSVKGQSMLSWISEDDFDFDSDEKAGSSFEAPFLSLNLDALAEQLGKAKLSERLFLESDVLLPPELLNDEIQACGEDNDHVQNRASAVELDSEASSSLVQYMDEIGNGQPYGESMSPFSTVSKNNYSAVLKGLHTANQTKDNVAPSQETEQKFISKPNMVSSARKLSTFEAANAEADLNMLLNSFAETKFLEPSNPPKKSGHASEIFRENTPPMSSVGMLPVQYASADIKKDTDRMKTLMSVNFDDDIDTRLTERANTTQVDGRLQDQEFRDITSLPLDGSSKSKLQDDFDSWLDSI
ncbi:hypothetical protein F511_04705 [Dorcoceras hygrometricum]|uniref:Uncharacterized protein n=1 Tax=Dorcoceras hygrometricum TaxID=472368 RepID=A0A2Z7B6V1_9LAMI|nr:hypothetical protein F511_04705 [Dorcoceras hygrometricum]